MERSMSDPALFAFNKDATVKVEHIGRCRLAVCRIGNVLCDAGGVATLGFEQSFIQDHSNLYPGLRARVPAGFSTALRKWLTSLLQENAVLERDRGIASDASFFSFVATASADLSPIQCIPHYDSTDPNLWAAVIYLCDRRFSGTSFYRHRRTGYEEITELNQDNYQIALDADIRRHGIPKAAYVNGDGPLFESIFSNALEFNSAIVYPGRVLHAANIDSPFSAPDGKNEWRLTVTSLLKVT
jgi:hypothetical protein